MRILYLFLLMVFLSGNLIASDNSGYGNKNNSRKAAIIQKLVNSGYTENIAARTIDEKHFSKGAQSVLIKGGQPLHYKTANGEWKEIAMETNWIDNNNEFYGIEEVPVQMKVNSSQGDMYFISENSEFKFSGAIKMQQYDEFGNLLHTENAKITKAKVNSEVVLFENIFPDIDMVIKISPLATKTNFIIKSKPSLLPATASVSFTIDVNEKNNQFLSAYSNNNNKDIQLFTNSDTLFFSPILIHDNDLKNTNKHTLGWYEFDEGDTQELKFLFDKSAVFNATTQYPVTVDPYATAYSNATVPSCYYPSYYAATIYAPVPAGQILGKTYFETDFYAYNGAYRSEQRHYIQGPSATSPVFAGGAYSGGYELWSGFLDVSQGHVSNGSVPYTWYVSRTWGGSGCNTTYNIVTFRYVVAFYGPCPNTNNPASPVDRGSPSCGSFTNISVASGTYVEFDVVQGVNYDFSTCGSSFDTEISGYNGASGLFYNDDNGPDCNPSLQASVNWTATYTGKLRILINNFDYNVSNCQSNGSVSTLKARANGGPIGVWTGNGSNRYWENPVNWECGIVPNTTTNVLIPNTGNNPLIRNSITGNCRTIEVQSTSGALVEIATGGTLNVTQ